MKSIKIVLSIFISIYITAIDSNACNPPYNSKWSKAKYPYAQAPDGCSGLTNPEQVRDTWGRVDFRNACNAHDECYYTYGSSWQSCNEKFLKNLKSSCWNDLRNWVPPVKDPILGIEITPGFYLPPEPHAYAACNQISDTYYSVVQLAVVAKVFKKAQEQQKEYNNWILAGGYCNTPPPPPPTCPTGSDFERCQHCWPTNKICP